MAVSAVRLTTKERAVEDDRKAEAPQPWLFAQIPRVTASGLSEQTMRRGDAHTHSRMPWPRRHRRSRFSPITARAKVKAPPISERTVERARRDRGANQGAGTNGPAAKLCPPMTCSAAGRLECAYSFVRTGHLPAKLGPKALSIPLALASAPFRDGPRRLGVAGDLGRV
jgi:hypothetical protein